MTEYRLISIYYSPEFTRYVLQRREPGGQWQSLPTLDARDLPEQEREELRRPAKVQDTVCPTCGGKGAVMQPEPWKAPVGPCPTCQKGSRKVSEYGERS